VTILDANLKNEKPVAEKFDCAAPGKANPWTIRLPSGLSGHYVLRWYWEGRHVSPGEPYEQCIDLNFGGGSGGGGDDKYNGDQGNNDDDENVNSNRRDSTPAPPKYEAPAPTPSTPDYNQGNNNGKHNGKHRGHQGKTPLQDNYNSGDSNSGSSGGSCTAGAYKCSTSDNGFYQCANGSWVKMQCPPSTVCKSVGAQITCDWAQR